MVQEPTKKRLRNRKYIKTCVEKPHFYAKDELTKKLLRDIREQLYKSFMSLIPHSKLNNKAYQMQQLRNWLLQNEDIFDFESLEEEKLVTVFCHLRVRKLRAKGRAGCLNDLEGILAGSKFKTI